MPASPSADREPWVLRTRPPLPDGPVVVVGLARSGISAAKVLARRGHRTTGVDGKALGPAAKQELEAAGVDVHDASDGRQALSGARWLVKSPGVPREAPVVQEALARGLPVLGELEVGWRLLPNPVTAITGSNGKTTTTELVGHLHRTAGLPVRVAGNVGTALTSLVDAGEAGAAGALDPATTLVVEASSFQLEDALELSPECAVLLNLQPDHLDRHGTFEAYAQAKLNVFRRQHNEATAVAPSGLGVEDLGGCARRVCFGLDAPGAELSARSGQLFWDDTPLLAVEELALRGAHNVLNALAAAAATLARGVAVEAVREGLKTFPGVPHRLEEVATIDGVTYVNDSKATNVDAAITGLSAFPPQTVHWIAGGSDKGADFAPLAAPAGRAAKAVHLIGETGPRIAEAVGGGEQDGTLERAVARARAAARPGDVVLLSPACASFDQFDSYEHRGDTFRELVRKST